MNRFTIVTAAFLVSTSSAWAGGADSLFEDKVKDFGVTPRGPVLVHYFRFTNTTNQTLTLGQPRVSCGCTSAAIMHSTVEPGKTSAIVAYMDTRRIPTPNMVKSVIVYVPFLAPNLEEVTLRVQTITRDDLMFSPDTIAFGTLRKGQGGKAATRISFTSDPNWQIVESASTGGFIKVDHKLTARNGAQVTYDVTATLDPACPVGNWVSEVVLKTSNPGTAVLHVPVTVNVVQPVAVSSESVQLGDMTLGNSIVHRVILQGTVPFKVLDVKGLDEQVAIKPDSYEARAVHVLTLSARPKILGEFNKSLEVVTDSREQPRISLAVIGKVSAP